MLKIIELYSKDVSWGTRLMDRIFAVILIILLLSFCVVSAEGSYSTEIIMKGTQLATEVYVSDSDNAIPGVIIVGGIHGDETAGVLAADILTQLMPKMGKVVIIPRANRPACERGVRTEYYMEDLNRSFPGNKEGRLSEYAAFSLVEAIAKYRPAIIIDLHESKYRYGEEEGSLGQSLVISDWGNGAEIVLEILEGLNEKVGAENEFTFASGAPMGSLNREISKLLDIPVITVETWSAQELGNRIDNHIYAVEAILEYFDMQ